MLANLKSAKLGILHPGQLISEAQVAFKLAENFYNNQLKLELSRFAQIVSRIKYLDLLKLSQG